MRQTIEGSEISSSVFGSGNRYRTLKAPTLTATYTIPATAPNVLFLGAAGAQNVVLPAAADGLRYDIVNTGAGTLTIQNPALATVIAIATGVHASVIANGTTWYAIGSSVA